MFFRFGAAVWLVVAISLAGTMLEKENLNLRRTISQQQFQREVLAERWSRTRLRAEELGTPARLLDPLEEGTLQLRRPEKPLRSGVSRPPLMRWESSPPALRSTSNVTE